MLIREEGRKEIFHGVPAALKDPDLWKMPEEKKNPAESDANNSETCLDNKYNFRFLICILTALYQSTLTRALSCHNKAIINFKPVLIWSCLRLPAPSLSSSLNNFSKGVVSHPLCFICFDQIHAQKCHSTLINPQGSLVECFNNQSPWSPGTVANSRKPRAKYINIFDIVTACTLTYTLVYLSEFPTHSESGQLFASWKYRK